MNFTNNRMFPLSSQGKPGRVVTPLASVGHCELTVPVARWLGHSLVTYKVTGEIRNSMQVKFLTVENRKGKIRISA